MTGRNRAFSSGVLYHAVVASRVNQSTPPLFVPGTGHSHRILRCVAIFRFCRMAQPNAAEAGDDDDSDDDDDDELDDFSVPMVGASQEQVRIGSRCRFKLVFKG